MTITALRKRQVMRLLCETPTILGLAMSVMLWCGVLYKHDTQKTAQIREESQTGRNLTLLFEEATLRSIGEVDKALLYLRRQIEAKLGSVDFQQLITTSDILSEIIVQAAIIDKHGMMRASNAQRIQKPIDLSDRDHYRHFLSATTDNLFISKPVIGRASGKWSIQIARRFLDQSGAFAGVVVASLDPEHLTRFFSSINVGATSSVSLIGMDGIVRASSGAAGQGRFALGQNLSQSLLFKNIQKQTNGRFFDPHVDGSDDRFVSFRHIRGQPLAVSISIASAEVFETLYWDLLRNCIVALLITIAAMLLSFKGARDQLELRKAAAVLRRSELRTQQKSEQLRLTLDNMSQGIILVTKDLRIPVINSQAIKLLGLPERFLTCPPTFTQLVRHQEEMGEFASTPIPPGTSPTDHFLQRDKDGAIATYERERPDGTILEVRSSALPNGGFVRTYADITRRRQAQAIATRLANEDALTGLPNRRVLRETADAAIATQRAATVAGADQPVVALLCLDLDRFKAINDTLGHPIGDQLLQAVSKRILSNLRLTDLVSRLGGDEFAVLLPELPSMAAVEEIAARLVVALSETYQIADHKICISVSIGVAFSPRDGDTADALLKAADLALYAAKADGRSTFRIYDTTMSERVRERRTVEIDLQQAMEHGELELHYQPLVSVCEGIIKGFEALMRWRHPVRGNIPPSVFIPIAEETGQIVKLGAWALRTACAEAASWPGGESVAVNVSSAQFKAGDLVATVAETLLSTGLASCRLQLEITESILMQDSDATTRVLTQLQDLGVKISMDDFGTGYSSLSYLRMFPLNKIKIDRSFVNDLGNKAGSEVIIRSMVDIARTLNMTVTAEGVETAQQLAALQRLGAQEFQGYHYSRPVPCQQITALLDRQAEQPEKAERAA